MSISDIDLVMFDLDGTIYYGSKIIEGANDVIDFFRNQNIKIYFSTNNSTKTRRHVYDRLKKMDVHCYPDEVITSGYLAALYAQRNQLENIYIFGSMDLVEEFHELGISVTQSENAENLLIGYNPKMTYDELTNALQVALQAKCIIACNRERVYPGENARLMPGCGAMTAPIEWCANRTCDIIIGKPSTYMVEVIGAMNSVDSNRILVIGDTYESDIVMAKKAGCQSILISTDTYSDTLTVSTIREIIAKYF